MIFVKIIFLYINQWYTDVLHMRKSRYCHSNTLNIKKYDTKILNLDIAEGLNGNEFEVHISLISLSFESKLSFLCSNVYGLDSDGLRTVIIVI